MHQRKSKKILLYFFLLFIFGSINNVSLSKLKFDEIKKINILGINGAEKEIFLNDFKSLNLKKLFFLNSNEIINLIDSNTIIEDYEIFKKYPSTLNIKIVKTIFLAKINLNGEELLIGSNGKLSKSDYSNEILPYIFGKINVVEFLKFKKIIDRSKINYQDIKSFYYFKSKRWDIKLKNNVIIKLSKENTEKSLNDAIIFLNENKSKKIKIVDARINNQIILND
tara:strand:+ start:302 stop:973 length:672 start_codon:yes stop_codon:yes gene_type:complete